jgi:hypothetical protein
MHRPLHYYLAKGKEVSYASLEAWTADDEALLTGALPMEGLENLHLEMDALLNVARTLDAVHAGLESFDNTHPEVTEVLLNVARVQFQTLGMGDLVPSVESTGKTLHGIFQHVVEFIKRLGQRIMHFFRWVISRLIHGLGESKNDFETIEHSHLKEVTLTLTDIQAQVIKDGVELKVDLLYLWRSSFQRFFDGSSDLVEKALFQTSKVGGEGGDHHDTMAAKRVFSLIRSMARIQILAAHRTPTQTFWLTGLEHKDPPELKTLEDQLGQKDAHHDLALISQAARLFIHSRDLSLPHAANGNDAKKEKQTVTVTAEQASIVTHDFAKTRSELTTLIERATQHFKASWETFESILTGMAGKIVIHQSMTMDKEDQSVTQLYVAEGQALRDLVQIQISTMHYLHRITADTYRAVQVWDSTNTLLARAFKHVQPDTMADKAVTA